MRKLGCYCQRNHELNDECCFVSHFPKSAALFALPDETANLYTHIHTHTHIPGLRIRNDLFRIRIRIYLFFIPDPDPTRVLTIFYSFENFYLNFQVLKL